MNFSKTKNALFLIVLLSSCQHRADRKYSKYSKPVLPAKNEFVRQLGQLSFRRSFADIQFMNDETEIDKYLLKHGKNNPLLMEPIRDSILLGRLRELQLVKEDELLLERITPLTTKGLTGIMQFLNPIQLQVDRFPLSDGKIIFRNKQDSITFNI